MNPAHSNLAMVNPLILKLEHGVSFDDADRVRLRDATSATHRVSARQDIVREGEAPDSVHLVMDGLACRYKLLADGGRSIMALLLPGDFCNLHVTILREMDHGIATLTECTIVEIPRRDIVDLTERHPRIAKALWWATLVNEGILRAWLANLGKRDATKAAAHLFCELLVRLQAVGLADENSYDLPLTQQELSDVMALSAVHMNRTLQALRGDGLIVFDGKRLRIPNVGRLKAYAGFNPNYLHLTGQGNGKGRNSVTSTKHR